MLILRKLRTLELPKILKRQSYILMLGIIIPYWFFDLMQVFSTSFLFSQLWANSNHILVSFSTLFINLALIYCSRSMLGLRFLNWDNQVQGKPNIHLSHSLKELLAQLADATSRQEIAFITRQFFKDEFGIPFKNFLFHNGIDASGMPDARMAMHVSSFLCDGGDSFLNKEKILVFDELVLSNYYESSDQLQRAIALLNALQADIFLPIRSKNTMIGYIIIARGVHTHYFYSNVESDEMLIVSKNIADTMQVLGGRNIDVLTRREKLLAEELHAKYQENKHYKDIIRSFMDDKHKDTGILFYKNRQFLIGNKAAVDLIQIDPNEKEGHQCTKVLRRLVRSVELYKERRSMTAKNSDGISLLFTAFASVDNTIIINVSHPHFIDRAKKNIDTLKHSSEWDYLLCLQTTEPGKLINQLIPGTTQKLMDVKVQLLKTALGEKATLLSMAPDDVGDAVHLLHKVSGRNTLHVLNPAKSTSTNCALELFGINPIFNGNTTMVPLLERLDEVGTLFIPNIHLLDGESQERLAEFLRYGFFSLLKSDTRIASNVRIICATDCDLSQLVVKRKFSKELFDELAPITVKMPLLSELPDSEFKTILEQVREELIQKDEAYNDFLTLSKQEKEHLISERPLSMHELKTRVNTLLIKRSKENNIYEETTFDNNPANPDSVIALGKKMGKTALYYQNIMQQLAQKFDNNQNKIAKLLGVNRSSVCRYFKKYNIIA